MRRRRYLFTNKKNPPNGLFATGLGVLGLFGIFYALTVSYQNAGAVGERLGVTVLLSALFGVIGVIVGIRSHAEPDMFTFFPKLGIVLSALSVILAGVILYMGV